MELRQLEYFVTVAEEANFTRAADRVHISQSGVSAQVRQLERELGHDLLDRSGRTVTLTEVGAAVLPHARAALEAVASARLTVDQLAGLVHGEVRVGMVSGCALPFLADLLASFHACYPGIHISLIEGESDRLIDEVGRRHLDLALIGSATPNPAEVEGFTVLEEDIVAINDRESRTVKMSALEGQPLITLPPGTGVRTALDLACRAAGFEPNIVLEASALPMVRQLALQGLGTGIVPASIAPDAPRLRPRVRSRLDLIWNAGGTPNPPAQVLVETARSFPRS
jgi:DNA-binding transcriptional LysR family regulator